MNATVLPAAEPTVRSVPEMLSFSVEALPHLRLPSGLYCFDMPYDTMRVRGESVRYSLMVLLGMQRARDAGMVGLVDTDELWHRCLEKRGSFTPGDVGLALWAATRQDLPAARGLVDQLERLVPDEAALRPLVGMEIGWLVIGLAEAVACGVGAERPLELVSQHLQRKRRASSGLYFHDDCSPLRRHLPNFATQIYTVLALSRLARLGVRSDARRCAEALADQLLRLQLADGGWPWLFDAERGTVAERYEIYSVHQDAMAPMALLDLSELTGDDRWERAAVAGLAWSHGANELGVDLFDDVRLFAHRSIRRARPQHRLALVGNSASTRLVGRPVAPGGRQVRLNTTCRPYHLGWILEAWAGRADVAARHGYPEVRL